MIQYFKSSNILERTVISLDRSLTESYLNILEMSIKIAGYFHVFPLEL